ncbi:MAG: serine protease [Candidatus Obscuribacterales bacterium]|nr:serine protease [Candidatus Obscuribacterales bacterium]
MDEMVSGSKNDALADRFLLHTNDSFNDKLHREAQLLLFGIGIATANTAKDSLVVHPWRTFSETSAMAAGSYALGRLTNSTGPFRVVGPIVSTALSLSFAKNMVNDLPERLGTISSAVKSTWESPENQNMNQNRVSAMLGGFAFDAACFASIGLSAGKMGALASERKAIEKIMSSRFSEQIDQNVFRMKSTQRIDGQFFYGTAFGVDSSRLGTAFHVVMDGSKQPWLLQNRLGKKFNAEILAAHPLYDLALLKAEGNQALQAFPLSKNPLSQESMTGAIVGAPNGGNIELRPAKFSKGMVPINLSYITKDGIETSRGFMPAVTGGKGWRGMSGGPALDDTGQVIGVLNSTTVGLPRLFGLGTASIPSPALANLLRLVDAAKAPGASMNLKSASEMMGISEKKLLSKLQSGKVAGFLVPALEDKLAPANWEWRVVNDKALRKNRAGLTQN